MKKLFGLLMILSALFIAGNSYAQDRMEMKEKVSVEERAQKKAEHLKTELKLNDAQSDAVFRLIVEQEKQKEIERQKRIERMNQVDNSMKDILSTEQLAEYNKMKDQRKKSAMKHRKMMKDKAKGSCCSKDK